MWVQKILRDVNWRLKHTSFLKMLLLISAETLKPEICQRVDFDVAVSDGFTGNVALKLYEGMGSFFFRRAEKYFFRRNFVKAFCSYGYG